MAQSNSTPDRAALPWRQPWVVAVAVVYLFLAVLFCFRVPLWSAPDEPAHFQYVEHLVRQRSFPVFADKSIGVTYEAHQPPLYYLLCTPVYLLTQSLGKATMGFATRLLSVVMGLFVVLLVWRMADAMFPRRPFVSLGAAAFAAALPSHLYVASSISNDELAILLCTAAICLLITGGDRPLAARDAAAFGALAGLAMLTKSSCLFLLPVGWAQALEGAAPEGRRWQRRIAWIVVATVICVGISSPWAIRNTRLYGDPLALTKFKQVFRDNPHPSYFLDRGMDAPHYIAMVGQLTFLNFWGVFGEINDAIGRIAEMYNGDPKGVRPLFSLLVAVFLVITVTALVGLLVVVVGDRSPGDAPPSPERIRARIGLRLLALGLALVVINFVQFNSEYFQAQARYLLPMLSAFAVGYALGLSAIPWSNGRRWAGAVLGVALFLVGVLDVTAWR